MAGKGAPPGGRRGPVSPLCCGHLTAAGGDLPPVPQDPLTRPSSCEQSPFSAARSRDLGTRVSPPPGGR